MVNVSTTVLLDAVANSRYVPFRGVDRSQGPIGTLQVHAHVTGDAGGGTASVTFSGKRLMFGFHGLYVPRGISTTDNQASGTAVKLQFSAEGNERMFDNADLVERKRETVDSINVNSWSKDEFCFLIECDQEVTGAVMTFLWAANVDTKVYHARVFFIVYDLEAISKRGLWVPDGTFLNS